VNRSIEAVLAATLAFSSPAFAQALFDPSAATEVEASQTPQDWGGSTPSVLVVGAYGCEAFGAATTVESLPGSAGRYVVTPSGQLICPVEGLPSGASIVSVELEACDTSTTGAVVATFGLVLGATGSPMGIVSVSTGAAASPGCAVFPLALSPTTQVNNATRKYYVQVTNSTTNGTTSFNSLRVFYRLNVAPAPATATFSDVPVGHPQRQFIEALVAAGVTGGCGAGTYCPDAPLTRGQMAVFLSVALGLQFTP
jgi:hypothetical protein